MNVRRPVHQIDATFRRDLALFERRTADPSQRDDPKLTPSALPPKWSNLAAPDLPIRWTARVVRYVEYLSEHDRGRRLMRGWLRRLARYEDTLRPILAEAGVPTDLVFVALAESGFDPRAHSRVGAAGLWQFMKPTGSVYGLKSHYWVDDRFDIIKSTFAAGAYLDDLHTRFGTWELALAAFNAGYGLVAEAIRRNNTNDYWALCEIENGLPYATSNYTAKVFAAAIIARNAESFGFTPADVDPYTAVDPVAVQLDGGIRLSRLAKQLGIDGDLLAELNAHFVRGRTPPKQSSTGYLPAEVAERFKQQRSSLELRDDGMETYVVRLGDDLDSIAAQFGTTARRVRRENRVFDSGELAPGLTLLVPRGDAEPTKSERPLVAVPPVEVPVGHKRVFFRMTRATNGRHLAAAFGVRYSDLIRGNDLDPQARIQLGQIVQVVVREDFSTATAGIVALEVDEVELVVRGSLAHLEAELARRGLVRRGYRARKGSTLARVGKRFGLSVGSLARINGFSRRHKLKPGEVITVYVKPRKLAGTVAAPPVRGDELSSPRAIVSQARSASTPTTAKLPGRD
ncbi:MAG: LysM peptidoglycan-binding domain-containing protein [Myxococcales bacterium FL481]|nr:MAG: LysM peptidoglycan-binding domain-containing protein [Myxococcales bacterium FL481]